MASSPYAVRRKLTKMQREQYIGRMRRLFAVLYVGDEAIPLRNIEWSERVPLGVMTLPPTFQGEMVITWK